MTLLSSSFVPWIVGQPSLAASGDLHLLIRGLHVLAVTLLLGGAGLAWAVLARADGNNRFEARNALSIAESYEWLSWGAVGVVVMTGVGNLGVFAPSVPGPATAWGMTFGTKLLLVFLFLVFSAGRTLFVRQVAARARNTRGARGVASSLTPVYAITTVGLVVLLALAEVLAHG